ncbi:MAG: BMP family ABC transporter substrate-binding protein [Eubacteriales bacterium]|nr:BMP family ABC transporter substrate-binding protein [Eubacteriales bacterium]
MKKRIAILAAACALLLTLSGCSSAAKLAVVTGPQGVDDGAVAQAVWQGLVKAEQDSKLKKTYARATGMSQEEVMTVVDALYEKGYRVVLFPGVSFAQAAAYAQEKYQDMTVCLMGGQPQKQDGTVSVQANSLPVVFAEQQAGFAAGVAAAVQLNQGTVGFLADLENNPSAQRYLAGFQQGLEYAAQNQGTQVSLLQDCILYAGAGDQVIRGQDLAAQLYDKGCKAVFCVGDEVSVGTLTEAKARAALGENVWVVGADYDRYAQGTYNEGKSVVLTNAIKNYETAAALVARDLAAGKLTAGAAVSYSAAQDCVGLPAENPGLSQAAVSAAQAALDAVKSGAVTVSEEAKAPSPAEVED